MPRFPIYEPEVGLDVPEAPRIQADTAMAQALVGLGHTVDQIGQRWTQRAKEQADFDDQVKYRRHSLAQAEAARRAEAAMPPQAQGFHDALMAARQQADTDFLQTISPDNRRRYAGLLSIDADRTSIAAARAEFKARGSYEQAEFGRSADEMAAAVRANPALAPAALGTLKLQHDSQSSLLPTERAAQWQSAEQALAAASWLGHFADGTGLSRSRLEEGIKALGISSHGPDGGTGGPALPTAGGPVDPRFAALPAARRLQLATQASQALDEAKAGARASLEQDRQAGLDGLFLGGAWQGPALPPERFIAAYGPEDGRQQFEAFARLQTDAPTIAALLRQPDGAQDAALNHYATAGGADGQRLHAVAAPVVARLRAERAGDPVTTLGKLYPAFGQSWAAATAADPQGFRQALPGLADQADILMDGLGWGRGQRNYLPEPTVSRLVSDFHDTSKPLAERIAPLRGAISAFEDPARQLAIFQQAMNAGLPRLAAPALAAYGSGRPDSAGRLLAAAFDRPGDEGTSSRGAGAADSAAAAQPTSPLALRTPRASAVPMPPRSDTAIDLAPSVTEQLARLDDGQHGDGDVHPLTALLFDRLVQRNLASNGGDLAGAEALARQDLRLPVASLSAQIQPNTVTDVLPDAGTARPHANDNGGSRIPPSPGAQTNTDAGKPAVSGAASPPTAANQNIPGEPGSKPGLPSPSQVPRTPPPSVPPALLWRLLRGGGGRAADPAGNAAWDGVNRPQNPSQLDPDTGIPGDYSLSPFGGTRITPAVSGYILRQVRALPRRDDPKLDEFARAAEFGEFNSAINAARFHRMVDQGDAAYHPYYTAGGLDVSFAPQLDANGEAILVAVRKAGRQPTWLTSLFGDKGEEPGPWWGTPAPENPPDPAAQPGTPAPGNPPATSPQELPDPRPGATSPGDPEAPPASQPTLPRPAWSDDDPYDPAIYDAVVRSTGDRNLAHAIARDVARSQRGQGLTASGAGGTEPPAYAIQSAPAAGEDDPYDHAAYDAAVKAGLSEQQALVLAKENYRKKFTGADLDRNKTRTIVQSPRPAPVSLETDWVKELYDTKKQAEADWQEEARRYAKTSGGKNLRKPKVLAIGVTNGPPVSSTNQRARSTNLERDRDTLAADAVRQSGRPRSSNGTLANETMADAHAEMVVIHALHDANRTEGQSLRMIVVGEAVCRLCRKDLAAAAQKAKLKDWTIYEEETGRTLYWKYNDIEFSPLEKE